MVFLCPADWVEIARPRMIGSSWANYVRALKDPGKPLDFKILKGVVLYPPLDTKELTIHDQA